MAQGFKMRKLVDEYKTIFLWKRGKRWNFSRIFYVYFHVYNNISKTFYVYNHLSIFEFPL